MGSGGVGEVATIFHPRRTRAPSIVLNEEQQNNGPYASPVQVILDTSSGCDQQGCSASGGCSDASIPCRSADPGGGGHSHQLCVDLGSPLHSASTCHASCCNKSAKKIYFGVCVTICVTASWVGATHCMKYLYYQKPETIAANQVTMTSNVSGLHDQHSTLPYNAPFFTTWFCTNWAVLYFPVYFLCRVAKTKCSDPSDILHGILNDFAEKQFTGGRLLTRCSLFCVLWVVTNYTYIHSLRILLATDVMALFATNVCCVYLLSWVILHEQFVGVRIVAVILCDTGIALFAYMDGISGSPTLGSVVLAVSAAAGSAVYKVLFKKVIGETTFGQVSLFFSLVGLCNAALLWPICLALYFSGVESIQWNRLPWPALLSASILHLVANMLGNFSSALTYDLFITLGLITAVPVSAALDVVLYGAHFVGMKLAGMILIAVGFLLTMFPDNWPDYITRLLRNIIAMSHNASTTSSQHRGGGRTAAVNRSRRQSQSIQQRQFRRNYGVSSTQGDGQTLLPLPSTNNTNLTHHRSNINTCSSSEPSRRVPTSNSTTTNNHHRSLIVPQVQQDGAGDTGTVCPVVQHGT